MSRWNEVCVMLGNSNRYQDESGAWHEGEPDKRTVYCNRFTRGFKESSNPDVGLTEVAEIQVRTWDYRDQPRVQMGKHVYNVTSVSVSGDFTRLQLERVISNE